MGSTCSETVQLNHQAFDEIQFIYSSIHQLNHNASILVVLTKLKAIFSGRLQSLVRKHELQKHLKIMTRLIKGNEVRA